jgi:hypothetical protein
MKIQDMSSAIFDVSTEADVERILLNRYCEGVNAFWLYHEPREKPWMLILVKDQLADLNYFPDEEGHPDMPPLATFHRCPLTATLCFSRTARRRKSTSPTTQSCRLLTRWLRPRNFS